MLGLFKPKMAPEGPVEMGSEVEIDRSVEEVYALIDWADPRNAKRATGNEVREVPGKPGQFEMVMPFMDDVVFEFLVTEAVPHRKYAFGCVIKPSMGNLAYNHETYELEPLGDDKCRLTLTCETTFFDGLRMGEFTQEVATMAASVQSSLQKFKLQAEHGAEVAKAVEENTLL